MALFKIMVIHYLNKININNSYAILATNVYINIKMNINNLRDSGLKWIFLQSPIFCAKILQHQFNHTKIQTKYCVLYFTWYFLPLIQSLKNNIMQNII